MQLTKWEGMFLQYYLNKYNAKWIRVYNNKHPVFETRVFLATIYKKFLKHQPIRRQLTYPSMFQQLIEGEWYFIPSLLENDKEE